MNIALIAGLLNALSTIALNPNLKHAGSTVSAVLQLLSSLVLRGAEGAEGLKKLSEEVDEMVKNDRQPSPGELKSLRQRSNEAHALLQGQPIPAEPPPAPAPTPVPTPPMVPVPGIASEGQPTAAVPGSGH